MSRVVHFEIYADDPERAVNFYRNVFNWKIDKFGGSVEYWMVMTGEGAGIDGGLMKRAEGENIKGSKNAYVCTIEVSNIEDTIKKIKTNKGRIESSKHVIPGVGWLAYFCDTEENLVGIMQGDKNAR